MFKGHNKPTQVTAKEWSLSILCLWQVEVSKLGTAELYDYPREGRTASEMNEKYMQILSRGHSCSA